MGQAAIPIILALGAAGVSAYNTSRTASKQTDALLAGLARQREIDREALAGSDAVLGRLEKSTPEPERARLSDQYRRQIRLKQPVAFQAFDTPIDLSDPAIQRTAEQVATSNAYADLMQGLFARVDAPTEQRRAEGYDRLWLGDLLNRLRRETDAERGLTDLRVRGIQRNPWLDILAAGLSGASGGLATGSTAGGIAASALPQAGSSAFTPQGYYSQTSAARFPGQYGNPTGNVFRISDLLQGP